jgi:hypothetical protein
MVFPLFALADFFGCSHFIFLLNGVAMKAQPLLPQWIVFLTSPDRDNPDHYRSQKQHYRDRHSRHSQNSGNRPVEDQ